MPEMPPFVRPSGQRSAAQRRRDDDQRRGSAKSRGYGGAWPKERALHLKRHPFCAYCEAGAFGEPARVTAATLVDHLYPHRQFGGFWLKALWVSSCDDCHSGPKQALERLGRAALDRLARALGRPTLEEAGG